MWPALQGVFDEYRASLTIVAERVLRLDRAITEAITTLAAAQHALIEALATLRGVLQIMATTLCDSTRDRRVRECPTDLDPAVVFGRTRADQGDQPSHPPSPSVSASPRLTYFTELPHIHTSRRLFPCRVASWQSLFTESLNERPFEGRSVPQPTEVVQDAWER